MKLKITAFVSIAILLAGLVFGWLAVRYHMGDFSPDSYSYYDISRTFGGEFGKVNTIRQYVVRSDYNCSFPYVFPFLIFLTDKLTGFGMDSGTLLNCLLMLLTGVVFLCLSQRFTKSMLCGAVASALLCLNREYLEEVYAGRSIPLAILLTAVTIWLCCELFLAETPKLWYAPVIGILAGLNAMTRFDEISLLAYLIPVVWIAAGKHNRLRTVLSYGLGAGVVLLPWCVYCMQHFGTPYFTDNNGTMWNVVAEVPNYVYLPDDQHLTIRNAPDLWTQQHVKNMVESFLVSGAMLMPLMQVCLVSFAVWAFQKARNIKNPDEIKTALRLASGKKMWYILGAIGVYAIAKLCMYALVGYGVSRYYVEPVFLLGFALLLMLYMLCFQDTPKMILYVLPLITALNLFLSVDVFHPFLPDDRVWIQELDTALQASAETPEDSVLIVGDLNGFSFGALTDWKTYVTPDNVTPETVDYVLQHYADVQWIAFSHYADSEMRAMLAGRYQETEYTSFYLYHLTGE